jgi:hypothetical protein
MTINCMKDYYYINKLSLKLAIAVVAIILSTGCGVGIQKKKFLCRWNDLYNRYTKDSNSEPWLVEDRPDLIFRKVFTDRSWIILRSQSVAGGSQFDATISLDSNGSIFWTNHAFSGYEGLGEEVSRIRADSIKEFYDNSGLFEFQKIENLCP